MKILVSFVAFSESLPKEFFTEDNQENEDLAKIQGKLLY